MFDKTNKRDIHVHLSVLVGKKPLLVPNKYGTFIMVMEIMFKQAFHFTSDLLPLCILTVV